MEKTANIIFHSIKRRERKNEKILWRKGKFTLRKNKEKETGGFFFFTIKPVSSFSSRMRRKKEDRIGESCERTLCVQDEIRNLESNP